MRLNQTTKEYLNAVGCVLFFLTPILLAVGAVWPEPERVERLGSLQAIGFNTNAILHDAFKEAQRMRQYEAQRQDVNVVINLEGE